MHKKCKKAREIAELLNLPKYAVSRMVHSYKKEGMNCVKEKIRSRSISNYLDRWEMTCQRPTKRTYSQDDAKFKTFIYFPVFSGD